MNGVRGRSRRRKPNWLRRLARDWPAGFQLVMRVREKSRIVAGDVLPAKARQRATPAHLNRGALLDALSALGVESGDTLMVHSAWENAAALAPTPAELVGALQETIDESGTLCMPAYPRLSRGEPSRFDVRRTPSTSGLLSEVFRRTPGALRSAQLRSVAAVGPRAAELTAEHHLSPYASGRQSPYAKLAAVGGKVLCLGVGPEFNTMFHCGEDTLESEFPVHVYEDGLSQVQVVGEDGTEMTVATYVRSERWTNCCDAVRLFPYLRDVFQQGEINGVAACLIPADAFLERLVALARSGIHMYGFRFPPPRRVAGRGGRGACG